MITNYWQKSFDSNPSGNCLEAKGDGDNVLVRDTKLGEASPVFAVPVVDWEMFLAEVKGFVTFPAARTIYTSDPYTGSAPEPGMRLHSVGTSDTLLFTVPEWDAFLVGARAGQFDLQPA